MTLQNIDKLKRARLAARERVFLAGEVVGYARRTGTLTAEQLDELRDAVTEYDRVSHAYIRG